MDLSYWEIAQRVIFSLLAGAAIGIEREWNAKPAGIRTYALVCEGSALFMIASLLLGAQMLAIGQAYDPSRIGSTIVQGIGFLAAGVIFMRGSQVHGLTTAAAVWVAAGLGLLIGAGFFAAAGIGLVATLFTLTVMKWMEDCLPTPAGNGKGKVLGSDEETPPSA